MPIKDKIAMYTFSKLHFFLHQNSPLVSVKPNPALSLLKRKSFK